MGDPLAAPSAPAAAATSAPGQVQPFAYDGQAGELFVLYVKNLALTLLTLGVYRFWAQVALQRYQLQHTLFQGERFDFHATGKERLLGFLKGLLILSPVIAALVVIHSVLVRRGLEAVEALAICFYLFLLVLFLLRPLILVGALRFRLSRTSWNGLRFSFDGRVGEAYVLYLRDALLMVLTLGFFYSWHQVAVRRFQARGSSLGGQRFDFQGTGLENLGIMVGGSMATYLTLGIFAPWWVAMIQHFHTNHLSFGGRRFRSTLDGAQVLLVGLTGLLATVLTLGLALPWAIHRWTELSTRSVSYLGEVDLDALRGSHDARASALGEGLGEAGEALESLGQILGG